MIISDNAALDIISISYKFIVKFVLDLSGVRGDSDESNLNNLIIWPKEEINGLFFVLEIFSYIEF